MLSRDGVDWFRAGPMEVALGEVVGGGIVGAEAPDHFAGRFLDKSDEIRLA